MYHSQLGGLRGGGQGALISVFSDFTAGRNLQPNTHSCCKGWLSPPQACLQAAVVIGGSGALGPLSCWPPMALLVPISCRGAGQTSPAWAWDTVLTRSWRTYSWNLSNSWANTILKTNKIHFVPSVRSSCFADSAKQLYLHAAKLLSTWNPTGPICISHCSRHAGGQHITVGFFFIWLKSQAHQGPKLLPDL